MEVKRLSVTIYWEEGGETHISGEINGVLDKITDLMMEGTEEDIGTSFTVGEEVGITSNGKLIKERR